MSNPNKITVLFDGVCNLCNGAVQFIIKRDPDSTFRFASLQSDYGQAQLRKFGLDTHALYSIIVIEGGSVFQQSDAALKIAAHLHGPWRFLRIFRFVPRFLRDGVYHLVATYRYKIFGKNDHCLVPAGDMRARFIE